MYGLIMYSDYNRVLDSFKTRTVRSQRFYWGENENISANECVSEDVTENVNNNVNVEKPPRFWWIWGITSIIWLVNIAVVFG